MLKSKVVQQIDPFKSCILTGKRLVNALKDWDYMNDIQQHQLREDTLQISDAITNLLTKVQIKKNLDTLKRLHLAPEQLKKQIVKIESGNHSSVEQTIAMLQDILQDIDVLKKEGCSVKSSNLAPALPLRTPPREMNQSKHTNPQINSPSTPNLFSEIDKALDFTLPDFATGSLLHKTSDSNTSSSTISDLAPTKLTRAVIEKPRPKVIIKSVSTKPTFNPLEMANHQDGTPAISKTETKSEATDRLRSPERVLHVPRPLPSTPSNRNVLFSVKDRTVKRVVPLGISMEQLEVLFREQFEIQDFEIWINHEKSGYSYILESPDDVYDGCLLLGREKSTDKSQVAQISTLLQKRHEQMDTIEKKIDDISRNMQPRAIYSDEKVKETCKKHMIELQTLKNTLEQFKYDVQLQLEETRSFFDSQLALFHSLVPVKEDERPTDHPKIPVLVKAIDESKESCQELRKDLKHYVELLETTRLDLTRGCRPSTHLYQYLVDTRNDLESRLQQQKSSFNDLKANKKVEWEATLQTILHEQKTVGESWDHLERIQTVMDEASYLSESIIPILLHQRKHKLPIKPLHLDVWDASEVHDFGKSYVLQEIKTMSPIERPEVNIIVENQRRMRVSSPNPFETELVEFTAQNRFKGKIGVDKVEERRRQKDQITLRELWKIT
jgi:predicted  nucleic acid-binding Zn-ribbon protein